MKKNIKTSRVKISHSEVNLIIQYVAVQDQDGQNINKITWRLTEHPLNYQLAQLGGKSCLYPQEYTRGRQGYGDG
jgi:hypothetical protein